ncbi:hypothetical protein BSL78_11391 [Apostichopus japonicus]|uniref:Uncharacterized protein n=1 Tax=Stichopus japonicus TaxID=307972 RepID=A0A2G8KUM9_STIJA|nr:hypothetical protein BSL78_11391 [Apostichopus japonicus]
MEGERKRVHKATAGMTVAQKLERKRASSRRSNLCRVRLGEHLKRWNRLKQEHGVSTDIDMAKILLDSFEAEEAVQTQPLTSKLNTSTPSHTATIVKEEQVLNFVIAVPVDVVHFLTKENVAGRTKLAQLCWDRYPPGDVSWHGGRGILKYPYQVLPLQAVL